MLLAGVTDWPARHLPATAHFLTGLSHTPSENKTSHFAAPSHITASIRAFPSVACGLSGRAAATFSWGEKVSPFTGVDPKGFSPRVLSTAFGPLRFSFLLKYQRQDLSSSPSSSLLFNLTFIFTFTGCFEPRHSLRLSLATVRRTRQSLTGGHVLLAGPTSCCLQLLQLKLWLTSLPLDRPVRSKKVSKVFSFIFLAVRSDLRFDS